MDVLTILKNHFNNINISFEDIDIPFETSEADTTKLQKIINWTPNRTLEDTIPEIIEFEKIDQLKETIIFTMY